MYYKPDWDSAKERMLAWWDHEVVDRCCIAIHAPRKGSKLPPFPDLQNGPWLGGLADIPDSDTLALKRWWADPEQNRTRAITWFENTYFGGEALPVTYVNWGAMALAGIYGSPIDYGKLTTWYQPVIEDWASWEWIDNPEDTDVWRMQVDIVEALADGAEGRYFVGKPELGNGADVLSLMRGMDNFAMDLVEEPEAVTRGVDVISDAWVRLMSIMHARLTHINDDGDVLAWMGLWAPGRLDQIACDFSTLISPQMMREFFIPEIKKMADWCENGVYHLDGPTCLRNHLDLVLEQPGIRVIQYTPGAGGPPASTPAYLPEFRKILASGRGLYLLVQPVEVEGLLRELGPEGLFMRAYVDSQETADDLLKKVGRWSASRTRG